MLRARAMRSYVLWLLERLGHGERHANRLLAEPAEVLHLDERQLLLLLTREAHEAVAFALARVVEHH